MEAYEIIDKLNNNPSSAQELQRTGKYLGGEILRKRMQILRQFANALGRIPEKRLNAYAKGYRAALMDVSRTVEGILYREYDLVELKEFIFKDEYHDILCSLLNGPKNVDQIARDANKSVDETHEIVDELKSLNLVEGFPSLLQFLTLKGEKIAQNII
jgi:hypothetical protein